MINGAHVILYSKDATADRTFFRDVLGLPSVDVGDGWLIFGLPPAEVAVHPGNEGNTHELYLMCDDIEAMVGRLAERGIESGPILNRGWGLITRVTLPSGAGISVYQPRHARPEMPGDTNRPASGKDAADVR